MTQTEIDELDSQFKNGCISEEEYVQALKDEVSRINPDIGCCELDNMVLMQLKSLAIDDTLSGLTVKSERPNDTDANMTGMCRGSNSDSSEQARFRQADAKSISGSADGSSNNAGEKDDFAKNGKTEKTEENADDNGNAGENNPTGGNEMIWWNFQWVPKWFLGLDTTVLHSDKGLVFIEKHQDSRLPDGSDLSVIENASVKLIGNK